MYYLHKMPQGKRRTCQVFFLFWHGFQYTFLYKSKPSLHASTLQMLPGEEQRQL